MMRSHCLFLLISLAPILVSPTWVSADTCRERSVAAGAVRTTDEVQAFVQCAYELVQAVGFDEARKAFNEDERWKSGPIYVFVDEMTDVLGGLPRFCVSTRLVERGDAVGTSG